MPSVSWHFIPGVSATNTNGLPPGSKKCEPPGECTWSTLSSDGVPQRPRKEKRYVSTRRNGLRESRYCLRLCRRYEIWRGFSVQQRWTEADPGSPWSGSHRRSAFDTGPGFAGYADGHEHASDHPGDREERSRLGGFSFPLRAHPVHGGGGLYQCRI